MLAPTADNHTNRKVHEIIHLLRNCSIVGAFAIATIPQSVLSSNPPRQDEWDKQIERDVKAGKLDKLAQEAKREYEAGETTPL